MFREVTECGKVLERLGELQGTETISRAAILYDWNNRWAIAESKGPGRNKFYEETVREHYLALRRYGVDVDLPDEEQSLKGYRLIAAPMLYLVKEGLSSRLERFAEEGGTLLLTYFSGVTDENDLCFEGGFPGPLGKLAGIRSEELDLLYPEERRSFRMAGEGAGMDCICRSYCEVIHTEGAEIKAAYTSGWYAGSPALTRHKYGKGQVWYLAARPEQRFLVDLYGKLLAEASVPRVFSQLPEGVTLSVRESKDARYFFYINWNPVGITLQLPRELHFAKNLITMENPGKQIELAKLGAAVLKAEKSVF